MKICGRSSWCFYTLFFCALLPLNLAGGQEASQPGNANAAAPRQAKYTDASAWTQNATADLGAPGAKTVSLQACQPGVLASEPHYYVYISGSGTPEAVLVTGGSCAGDGKPGTLQFTTLNPHPAGYAIGSASSGLQEAIVAARFEPTNPSEAPQAGKVLVSPGELKIYGRVSIRSSGVTVDFSGSILECYVKDACIFAGDPASSTAFRGITLLNPRGRPMVAQGQSPFIEVNAQNTRIMGLSTRRPLPGASFGSLIQVDDDQAFTLDGLDTTLGGPGVRCDASVCNPVVYAPGPFNTFSAVGWLRNLNLTLGCRGNGVDWQSGNTLRISDSVIQGYAQYGVRAGTKRGGYGGFALDNLYEEVGKCKNPLGDIGEAGVIAQGSGVFGLRIEGGHAPAGKVPRFAEGGKTLYRYYVVAQHASLGASNPLFAGDALSDGTGKITITTPDIEGASTFDLLRLSRQKGEDQGPSGTDAYAVVTGVSRASACANGVCTFTDPQGPPKTYTVASPTYFPLLDFWPGSLVLGPTKDTNVVANPAIAFVDNAPAEAVSVLGTAGPAVFAQKCRKQAKSTPIWISCLAADPPSILPEQAGTILAVKPTADGGQRLNLKGRLNFSSLGTGPGHIITLSDSNFQKTVASVNGRPGNDKSDAYIGYDNTGNNPENVGISLGAPLSISNYIGNVGDGQNWLERLTANRKEFKTDVQIDGNLSVTGKIQGNAPDKPGPALRASAVSSPRNSAGIAKAAVCSAQDCPAGMYVLNYYVDSTAACANPGPAEVAVMVSWSDESSAKTFRLNLAGAGVSQGESLALGNTSNFGSGSFTFWSSGTTGITYSTSYKKCSSGTASYALRMALQPEK